MKCSKNNEDTKTYTVEEVKEMVKRGILKPIIKGKRIVCYEITRCID